MKTAEERTRIDTRIAIIAARTTKRLEVIIATVPPADLAGLIPTIVKSSYEIGFRAGVREVLDD